MERNLRHIAIGIIVGVLILAVLILILPIKVLYDVPVESKTFPSKEWKLIQEGEQFRTEFVNYSDSKTPSLTRNFVFERGDVIDIKYAETANNGGVVNKDEVLLQFNSMMQTMRIQQALNEMNLQESMKEAGAAAMKVPLISEAKGAVELAKSNVKLQELNHQRFSQLLVDGVVSKAELDKQTNLLEIAIQELSMAEQRLESTRFEEKPENLDVFSAQIQAKDKELTILLAQQNSYNLLSPFTGRMTINPPASPASDEGVLVSLADTGSQSLLFPFPISARELVDQHSFISIETADGELQLPFRLKNEVAVVHGVQNCLGVALLNADLFSIGEIVSAKVVCDTVLLREYIYRKLL